MSTFPGDALQWRPRLPSGMEYARLGTSGLTVSRLALGGMSFGAPGGFYPWALDEDAAAPLFRAAVEAGIAVWDTANIYGTGSSEEIIGRAMRRYTRRDDVVLATKLFLPMHDGPGGSGLSRRAVLEQVDASLRRLGTEYIDLYQVHRFDSSTPVEETVEALHDLVVAGKVRCLGASSMWAWEFAALQHTARVNGWAPFVSMQDQYSLLMREEEREMFGLLADQGVACLPWSPLAQGRLTRPWGERTSARSHDHPDADVFGTPLWQPDDERVVSAVERIAAARGIPMAQVALAWVLRNPVVTAPIVGATRPGHLTDAVAALDVKLTEEEAGALEEHYALRTPTYYR